MDYEALDRLNRICASYLPYALTDSFALHKLIIQLQVHRSDVHELLETMRLGEDLEEVHNRYNTLNPDRARTDLITIEQITEMFQISKCGYEDIAVAWIICTAHREVSYLHHANVKLNFQIPDELKMKRMRLKVGNVVHCNFRRRKVG